MYAENQSDLRNCCFTGEEDLKNLERLLGRISDGRVDEEVLEVCPELSELAVRSEKLQYRRKMLVKSIASAKEASCSNSQERAEGEKLAGDEKSEAVGKRQQLIVRNLQEVLGLDKLSSQLVSGKMISVYWGTATTGRPHVGYLVPMRKIADFLQAGLKVTILFADLHAFLDNMKSTWELLENRVKYYEASIKALLCSLNVPIDRLHFVRGSTFQLTRNYTEDLLRLCSLVSQRDALKAGAEVVKQVESPLLSGLLYPLLQALDEQYLKVDGQFGGVDQRKIFILAEEQLPKLKLGKRWHLMNPMVPGLTGGKMSSSELTSKIDLLDNPSIVQAKITGASCDRFSPDNGVLAFYDYVLMPIRDKHGVDIGGRNFTAASDIRESFDRGEISEEDLKKTLSSSLVEILTKVQSACDTVEVKDALSKGYADVPDRKTELPPRAGVQLTEEGQRKLHVILEGLQVVGGDSHTLQKAVAEGRTVNILTVLAPKGPFHLGLIIPLIKILCMQRAGVQVELTILISSLEAFLEGEKCSWAARDGRSTYFIRLLQEFIRVLDVKGARIVVDTELRDYLSSEFALNLYKLSSVVTRDETAIHAGSSLSLHLVPLVYSLNLQSMGCDAVLLGEDVLLTAQLAQKVLASQGRYTATQLLHPILPGMDDNKMSCSATEFALDPLQTAKQTKTKIARSFCEPCNLQQNVALELAEQIVFPLLGGEALVIDRSADNGGPVTCPDYSSLMREFAEGLQSGVPLHPADLKSAISAQINALFEQVRNNLADCQQKLLSNAFPSNKGKGGKK